MHAQALIEHIEPEGANRAVGGLALGGACVAPRRWKVGYRPVEVSLQGARLTSTGRGRVIVYAATRSDHSGKRRASIDAKQLTQIAAARAMH